MKNHIRRHRIFTDANVLEPAAAPKTPYVRMHNLIALMIALSP
jgi:hypothetical protein